MEEEDTPETKNEKKKKNQTHTQVHSPYFMREVFLYREWGVGLTIAFEVTLKPITRLHTCVNELHGKININSAIRRTLASGHFFVLTTRLKKKIY